METSPISILNVWEQASCSTQCRPILLKVGASARIVKRSGSVNPLATKRALAFEPSGAVFQVKVHLIAVMRLMGMPALRTILKTEFEIH